MKLRQEEYCHNCNKYVIYEFDDSTERQIIICPNCGHQHYRELDEGTIVNIRLEGTNQNKIIFASESLSDYAVMDNDEHICNEPIVTKEFKIKGYTSNGRPIIDKTEENLGNISTEQSGKYITERRWGRDPSQRG